MTSPARSLRHGAVMGKRWKAGIAISSLEYSRRRGPMPVRAPKMRCAKAPSSLHTGMEVMNMNKTMDSHAALAFEELDAMDAPSEDSFWQGMIAGVGVIGMVALVAT